MKEPFVLYPCGLHLPPEIQSLIPASIEKESTIVGVAVGPSSLLNMHTRKKIEAYFGSCKHLRVFHGTLRRDALVFLKDAPPTTHNQIEIGV